jgi:hypothetical protein
LQRLDDGGTTGGRGIPEDWMSAAARFEIARQNEREVANT